MSFDLCVFLPVARLPYADAEELYGDLCDGLLPEREDSLAVTPGFAAFLAELSAMHPPIDQVPEDAADASPWSGSHDLSDRHIVMTVSWSRAEEIDALVHRLAKTHGLAVLDPQKSVITYADGRTG